MRCLGKTTGDAFAGPVSGSIQQRAGTRMGHETGAIVGIYTISRGTTQTLIARGIDERYIPEGTTNRPSGVVASIIQAHAEVLEGFRINQERAHAEHQLY